ncbi:hypothetical protein RRG08_065424 [Elysia crispata]|uniref:Uncharacterized protein n=1 Tax=Elysia crispata TaxID=231223 RepID=A0AAE0ZXR4_9GAST|nr:hypothetical protein RRG08_065424 [Elysia crispata]
MVSNPPPSRVFEQSPGTGYDGLDRWYSVTMYLSNPPPSRVFEPSALRSLFEAEEKTSKGDESRVRAYPQAVRQEKPQSLSSLPRGRGSPKLTCDENRRKPLSWMCSPWSSWETRKPVERSPTEVLPHAPEDPSSEDPGDFRELSVRCTLTLPPASLFLPRLIFTISPPVSTSAHLDINFNSGTIFSAMAYLTFTTSPSISPTTNLGLWLPALFVSASANFALSFLSSGPAYNQFELECLSTYSEASAATSTLVMAGRQPPRASPLQGAREGVPRRRRSHRARRVSTHTHLVTIWSPPPSGHHLVTTPTWSPPPPGHSSGHHTHLVTTPTPWSPSRHHTYLVTTPI